MCLAVPGKIVGIQPGEGALESLGAVGMVDFQGSRISVSLAFTPEGREGDWVLVHAGYALQILDEQAARETWEYLDQAEVVDLAEVSRAQQEPRPGPMGPGGAGQPAGGGQ